ncbi:hypothetical protein RI129_005455 [Pyrocoelia pectoralis]|uniref:Uncharacterized protein n=1 Tax=Pyrocoelia pectoralis TaxID=417401 RepID=A0AAN7VK56_9COLE
MDKWNGKVAIVTGASSGIGKEIAIKLVESGMIVAGLARRIGMMEHLAASLKGEKGELHAVHVDMTNEEDILKAFNYVTKNLGPIHVLVNNAGVARVAPLSCGKTAQWREIEAVKNMAVNNVDGHIIHINSVVGHSLRNQERAMYGASKFAVTSLTAALREELNQARSKTKITSISPGYVDTEIIDKIAETSEGLFTKETVDQFKMYSPALKSEDVAESVLFALSTPPHVLIYEMIIRPVGEIV